MLAERKYKMSRERFDEISAELHYLETVEEKRVSEQIKEARSFGDLSENSEYDEAKTEQGKLYSKIAELQILLDNAEIIETSGNAQDVISIGSKVCIEDTETDEEKEFHIVGSQEANPMKGRISDESPIGHALIGKRVGDNVKVAIPAGEIHLRILSVTN
ncbi:MAG: transcription elongation factor GreA [Ruminococcaceae bacterium]|nr:transcription elongation factor GreA [Oscillospiraceae bacterium]